MGYYILYKIASEEGHVTYHKFIRPEHDLHTAICKFAFWLYRSRFKGTKTIWAVISYDAWEKNNLGGNAYLPEHIPEALLDSCEYFNEFIQMLNHEIDYTIADFKTIVIEQIKTA